MYVISKNTFGTYNVHDIQSNSRWETNPYEDYVIIPESLVFGITETRGFCNIELNEEETEVVNFTPLEIPEIKAKETEPTQLDMLEAQVTYTALMTDTLL